MKIAIGVAAPIQYSTCVYVEKALRDIGHDAFIADQTELYKLDVSDADLFLCVDSGGPLNIPDSVKHKACMWYIDSRRNSSTEFRIPDDDTTAVALLDGGGVVFQAQLRDVTRLKEKVTDASHRERIVWVPLAADPDVWSNEPVASSFKWNCSFVGNCFDLERLGILNVLAEEGTLYWPGIEKAIMQDGASVYRNSLSGLNIPSWFGTFECYDINMRVWEILSCGVPLITNKLPELDTLGMYNDVHILTYQTLTHKSVDGETVEPTVKAIRACINKLLLNPGLTEFMGEAARKFIVDGNTYTHRVRNMLRFCDEFGVI
jgi:hypothetical protein